ncbi:mitochondrial uncoupling protein 5-like [Dioscorea cayenensis subsp. rotundata]|uniref:Mitochondrial uncoupling protein 5-like n=1 Tax=Dioscorea cayennensis subsp. rotundata TaxID=55577 RepID=A0AB40D1E0_DIOCR|nr:mitochondrial uncoupling protein 5-like [Dioscorea cayenensis subsp. rotundata]
MGIKGFVEGGIASIVAGCSTHPLDLIKVRMQLQGESLAPNPAAVHALRPAAVGFHTTVTMPHITAASTAPLPKPGPISVGVQILRSEGTAALFSGVSATVLRQMLYSTTRMGLYDMMKKSWSGDAGVLPLHRKIAAGLIAGAVGAAVGNPADVAMVRMQADGRLPAAQRRNYKSVVDAIGRMAREEGVTSLWRGSSLTVNRAMIVTASQLATYDQAKEAILRHRGAGADGLGTHVVASFAAGLVAAMASNPVDVVKTRVMNMRTAPGEAPPYAGALDCAVKTVRAEGVMALYKGFVPTVSRQGPFTVVLFVTLEQVKRLFKDV